VVLQGRPVSPRVVFFSLTHALMGAGLVEAAADFNAAREAVRRRWQTPPDLFACIGEPQYLDVAADFLIGWRPLPAHSHFQPHFCQDPRLCAGVQAKCVGTLYLSRRTPDLTWDRLLDAPVAFDDPLVALA